jgi:hypothetical protein
MRESALIWLAASVAVNILLVLALIDRPVTTKHCESNVTLYGRCVPKHLVDFRTTRRAA